MIKTQKYVIISVLFVLLIVPIFFGVYLEYLYVKELSLLTILYVIIGLILFLILNKIIINYGYTNKSIEAMRKQDVINAFINNNKINLLLIFPMIMINEELLFRYYLIGFLIDQLKYGVIMAMIISSLLFSLYHIHSWFTFKNVRILMLNLVYSFLLGLYNSYVVIILGIFPCILIHFGLALSMHYNLYKKYYKE